MRSAIARFFKLDELGTTFRTELAAGLTTFMTMAYIIFVNPAMVSRTGMDFGAVMMATCLSGALATIMMGLLVNYPIALAPGMGENAFFTFTVCLAMGIPWRVALGCVFVQGLLFILLTLTRFRQKLISAIPEALRFGIACGIGFLIAFIGLADAGIVVGNPATMVALGDVTGPPALLALGGLALSSILLVRKIRGALLWGILATALAGIPLGLVKYQGIVSPPPSMAPTFMQMDIAGALAPNLLPVIFIFLFMGVFDTVGTLAGVGEVGGFMKNGQLPRSGRALFTDAVGTCAGAAFGTPTVTCYIESASGITSGGRSGLASVVTGLLLLLSIFFAPLVKMIGGGFAVPGGATLQPVTAPAMILVGCMILSTVTRIRWDDFAESIPAFLTIIAIPLTFSIATGVAIGIVSYAAVNLFSGRGKKVPAVIYLLALLIVLRYVYIKIA